jgi:drug/metabolite transporter (DMT)-like permease
MWLIYAVAASVIWGLSYAAGGRVLQRGVSPVVLFFLDLVFGLAALGAYLTVSGKWSSVPAQVRSLGPQWVWLAVAVVATTAGNFLIFLAIAGKNATLASLIEITYPLFVALFAWVLFRDAQLTWPTALGALLILAGVVVIGRCA